VDVFGTLPPPVRRSPGDRRFRPCRKGGCPRTMPARQVVLLTPSKSSHPSQLLSRQHSAPITPLAATLMDFPATIANKSLTAGLTPLDATLTKNRGVGAPPFDVSSFRCPRWTRCICGTLRQVSELLPFPFILLQMPPPATPFLCHPYKCPGGGYPLFCYHPASHPRRRHEL